MTNKQVTVTLDEYSITNIQKIADHSFEGNFSMALRSFLRHNHLDEVAGQIDD